MLEVEKPRSGNEGPLGRGRVRVAVGSAGGRGVSPTLPVALGGGGRVPVGVGGAVALGAAGAGGGRSGGVVTGWGRGTRGVSCSACDIRVDARVEVC